MLTDEMPYRENRGLITAIDIVSPIASTALFVWAARIYAARSGRA
jgi:hypothetical protein